ncbi:hypothetical protein SLS60_007865 [Paraconiothyrium brasiliense]|uniref:DUF6697 domain-containing protein n=1 Tax=Paraconiothyrium brasiliense TaxID=300254 RepID=A0ABR3R3L0_9PLEO
MADHNPTANLNPSAGAFTPASGHQVSPFSKLELQYRVEDLEREQACSRAEISDLKTLYHTLRTEMDTLKKGGTNATVGPFRDQINSRFTIALDALNEEANGGAMLPQNGCCNNANGSQKKPYGTTVPPDLRSQTASSVPPHLRRKPGSDFVSVAPHLRNGAADGLSGKSSEVKPGLSNASNPLVTDGNVDTLETERCNQKSTMEHELTPPLSPKTLDVQLSTAVQVLSLPKVDVLEQPWKPQYIASLPELDPTISSKIPSTPMSFSGDFLRNHLGGIIWGPGLVFIPPPQPSILPDRVYYTVDPTHDPHLPSAPGQHGAKLVPFFNIAPEDNLDFDLPEDYDSSSNVPLFVLQDVPGPDGKTRKRYVYYGHYTQSRWSDKLDYDRMVDCVPTSVREYWAEELSASGRPEWVSDALRKHFCPAPAYHGALPAVAEDEGGSVAEEEMAAREEKVARDVNRHVKLLRVWKKEADMRTSLIRKDFILTAFDRADADDPAALRLWWEYLECVDWRVDFYNTLVTLQSRNSSYF